MKLLQKGRKMNPTQQLFRQSYAQAKAESKLRTTLVRTLPIRDPFEVYKLVCNHPGVCCIMESATHEGTKGRYSFVCLNGSDCVTIHDRKSLYRLKEILRRNSPPTHPLLPFIGGAVGYLGHELITLVEDTVPLHEVDPFGLPLGKLYFFFDMIVCDHETDEMHFVTNVRIVRKTEDEAYHDGCARLLEMERVVSGEPDRQKEDAQIGSVASNMTQEEYHSMVRRGKEHVLAGDVFQVVLSQRFQVPYQAERAWKLGLSLYEKLRQLNPSPYMFHMRFGEDTDHLTLLGASPEIAVHIAGREMRVRPIAGTRPRGKSPEQDRANAQNLKTDEKELAEHRMLVDLARNDVGRFCTADSIAIPELMEVEQYSHVMHLTSEVRGTLRDGIHPLDACLGALPSGTLSGAPKVRALQLIAELEKSRRGPYGGAFGWMTDKELDTCIFIRSAVIHKGMLFWQSGGGIVADSDPESEYQESLAKARAIETALKGISTH